MGDYFEKCHLLNRALWNVHMSVDVSQGGARKSEKCFKFLVMLNELCYFNSVWLKIMKL